MLSSRNNREGWLLRVIIIGILVGIIFVIFDTIVNAPEGEDVAATDSPEIVTSAPLEPASNQAQSTTAAPQESPEVPPDSTPIERTAEVTAEAGEP